MIVSTENRPAPIIARYQLLSLANRPIPIIGKMADNRPIPTVTVDRFIDTPLISTDNMSIELWDLESIAVAIGIVTIISLEAKIHKPALKINC